MVTVEALIKIRVFKDSKKISFSFFFSAKKKETKKKLVTVYFFVRFSPEM
jgi:hypothetical protein